MHPVARVFQFLFLGIGLVLLPIGFMMQSQPIDEHSNFSWECRASGSGRDAKQNCGMLPGNSELSLYDGENTGLTVSLAGVGLLVASVSIAVGGSAGANRGAGLTAAYGASAPVPAQPPVQPQPPAQGPGTLGGGY
jgi:hypothetical protein